MILDTECGDVFATNPFHRLVIQIDVRDFDISRERFSLQGEAVVLRSDLDGAGLLIKDRLIGTAMSELQFVNFAM